MAEDIIKPETFIFEENGYSVYETDAGDGMSNFIVYYNNDHYVGEFEDIALTDADKQNFKNTFAYEMFLDLIYSFEHDDYMSGWKYSDADRDTLDDDDIKWLSSYKYDEPKLSPEEEKALVESLCKSDTIVFHQTDPTTVMLDPIYEGKGFDVYKGSMWRGELSREAIHELIRRHSRVVCLGHGTPSGLLSGVIGKEEVPLLKDKKIFSMWCYAATFWKNNGFEGHGILTSDNFPSEVWECKSACDADVSKEWIFDNMMLAGEVAGRAMDLAWDNPQAGCDLFRKEYSEKSEIHTEDERKVVEFNTNSMQVV